MSIVFARTRTEYAPYADFWRIVQLAGFEIKFLDEVDWDRPDVVIATPRNGEWTGIPARRTARLVHWMLERPRDDADEMGRVHDGVDAIWASDTLLAAKLNCPYVFLGGVETFARVNVLHRKDFDVVSLMYWSPRRDGLRHQLIEGGISMADPNGDCWGERRETALNSSRLMINAHQDAYPWMEPIKFCLAGMYGLPLLSETSPGSGSWKASQYFIEVPLDRLADWVKYMLTDEILLARLGANAWRLVCRDYPFKACVRKAAESLEAMQP